jgi:hypothetical protein
MAIASSRRFGLLARLGGRAAVASLILTLCSVVFAAGPARADCDVLDPTCVVETVVETVDPATEPVSGTVEDTTGDVGETVEETVAETTETVEETVEAVAGDAGQTVDEIVGSGSGAVDDAIGGALPPALPPTLPGTDPAPPGTVDASPPAGGGAGNGSDRNGSSNADGPVGTPPGRVAGPFVLDPPSLGAPPALENTPAPQGFLGGLEGPLAQIAGRIAFPIALAALVLLFVAFQNRLDRTDPKLALAATSPDVLRFA